MKFVALYGKVASTLPSGSRNQDPLPSKKDSKVRTLAFALQTRNQNLELLQTMMELTKVGVIGTDDRKY